MKKLICLVLFSFSLTVMNAQTTSPQSKQGTTDPATSNKSLNENQQQSLTDVPDNLRNRFSTDFPDQKPMWTMDGSKYRAEYKDQVTGTGRAIIYDGKGNPMYTEVELKNNDYPVTISDYYSRTYPNEKYSVWSSQDNEGVPNFQINRNSETILFDEQGNYSRSNRRMDPKQ